MLVRVLSEWAGSPPCGVVADLPAALVLPRIASGHAEAVAPPPAATETAMVQPGERAIGPRGRPRKGRG
jgi:hypothetical protein